MKIDPNWPPIGRIQYTRTRRPQMKNKTFRSQIFSKWKIRFDYLTTSNQMEHMSVRRDDDDDDG